MANKLLLTPYTLELLHEAKPAWMDEEKWNKWVEDCVELVKPIDE